MSCYKHWKDCKSCGTTIHRNFVCTCGGDPWDVKKELSESIQYLKERSNELKSETKCIDDQIHDLKGRLKKYNDRLKRA
jgi:hypothetical protein